MKYKWKLWLIPLAVILALGIFKGGKIWGKDEAPPPDPVVQTVLAKEVVKVKIENSLSFTGSVEAVDEAVISAKVSGRVSQVAVENGAAVGAGQSLVSLENQEYSNGLAISQAALKKAEANLSAVRANYERFKELYQGGAVSKKEFDDLETALRVAEADAASAAAALANAEESLRNTTVSSPLSGVVANRSVNIGQVISPGVSLMTVKDISSVYVLVNVEQGDLSRIKPGLRARVTVDSYPGQTFDGVVAVINPAANKAARVFETKIKVSNPDQLLKPGMFAKAEIKTGGEVEVLAVSRDALTGNQGMFFVFLAQGDQVVRRQVEIGQIVDQLVEIKSGLTAGEKVAVSNVNKLKDGDRITVAE